MPRVAGDITWLVGNTPLVHLRRFAPGLPARLIAKLEMLNPTSSNKDRAVVAMIDDAERSGTLRPSTTVVESSAGDTAIALAMACAARGYRLVLTLPDRLAASRCNLLRALGAELVLTPAAEGMRGAMLRAGQLVKEIGDAVILQPFANPANAEIHARTTAQEIWNDTEGEVHGVVCPVGTGGMAAGCVRFFRERRVPVQIIGVEPAGSPVLAGGAPGAHDIPGIGAGFVPTILSPGDLDEVVGVADGDAYRAARAVARAEGLLVGPASGAALHAAREIGSRAEWAGRTLVVLLPDPGERYEDHPCFAAPPDAIP